MSKIIFLILSSAIVVAYRSFISIDVRYNIMSKKEYKQYRDNYSFFTRWFFIYAAVLCKNKYSRGEKKVIHHQTHLDIYMVATIFLHVALLILFLSFFTYELGFISGEIVDKFFVGFGFSFLADLIPLFVVEWERNKEYHKKRNRKK